MQYLKMVLKIKAGAEKPMDRFMSRLDRIAAERSKPVVSRKMAA